MIEDIQINIVSDYRQLDEMRQSLEKFEKTLQKTGTKSVAVKNLVKFFDSAKDPISEVNKLLEENAKQIEDSQKKYKKLMAAGDVTKANDIKLVIGKLNEQRKNIAAASEQSISLQERAKKVEEEYLKYTSNQVLPFRKALAEQTKKFDEEELARKQKLYAQQQETAEQLGWKSILKKGFYTRLNLADPSSEGLLGGLSLPTPSEKASSQWGGVKTNLLNIVKSISKFGKETKKSDGHFKKLLGRIKNISIYRAIRTALKWITSGFQEGLNNFVQYSSEANSTMSNLNSKLKQLRNTMGVTLASALQTLEPILTKVLDSVINLMNQLNLAIAKSQGKDFYQKATQNVEDYAKSVKKAQKLSFDTFEVLSGEQTSPLDMFKEEKIEGSETKLSQFFSKIINLISVVGKKIGDIINKLFESGIFDKLLDIVEKIATSIADVIYSLLDTGALETILAVITLVWDAISGIIRAVASLIVYLNEIGALKGVLLAIATAFVAIKLAALGAAIASAAAFIAKHPVSGSILLGAGVAGLATIGGLMAKAVNKSYVSGYANGGIPEKSELFYMNENGVPEALMNTGGSQTNVINQQQLKTLVRDGYIEAMTTLGMADGMTLKVDGSKVDNNAFARAIFPALKTESSRWGGNQL